jgi:hypothetical protein
VLAPRVTRGQRFFIGFIGASMITKDFGRYTIIFLHQEKSLRDHGRPRIEPPPAARVDRTDLHRLANKAAHLQLATDCFSISNWQQFAILQCAFSLLPFSSPNPISAISIPQCAAFLCPEAATRLP